MYNHTTLIRQKKNLQKQYENKKRQSQGHHHVDPEINTLKHQIDMIDIKLQKSQRS